MSLTQRVFSDAFRDMQRAMNNFDQTYYGNCGTRFSAGSLMNESNHSRFPVTDMMEMSNSYELCAELPGYEKKNINIEVAEDGRTLIVSGSMKETTTTSNMNNNTEPHYWCKERACGSFSRSFVLPTAVMPDKIKATFDNGILKLSIPKAMQAKKKLINIE